MALRFYDSFDHYTAGGDKLTKWTDDVNAAGQVAAGIGRNGTSGYTNSADTRSVRKTLDAQATWIVGTAFQCDQMSSSVPLIVLWDAGTRQVYLRINASAKLEVLREGGTILATGTATLTLNTYYYVEFKCTISDASGVAVVRLNEVVDINASGLDTKNTANATADQISINGGSLGGSGATVHYDDLYICDTSGGAPYNDFLGDVRAEVIMPNGNGTTSQLVGQDANSTDNYLNVDEAAPDGDTTYNESSTVGDKDTYNYGALTPTTGSVLAVQILPYARKTDAGTRSIKTVARHSGTEEDSADFTLATTYQYFEDIRTTKPGGGSWSISDVNAAEFGVKVSA